MSVVFVKAVFQVQGR